MTPRPDRPSDGASSGPGTVDAVRDAVRAVPGVAGLHGGRFGEIATYLPGRRVAGIRSDGSGLDIHVVLYAGADIRGTAEEIHRAAAAVAPGTVRVHIDDLSPEPLKEH